MRVRGNGRRGLVAALVLLALGTVVLWQTDRGDAAKAATTSAIEVAQGAPVVPSEFQGDVRSLPRIRATSALKPELESIHPFASKVALGLTAPATVTRAATRSMPSPAVSFDGLDFATWGAGHPPDTVGDVGTNFYVQAVNTSIGIFAKTGGRTGRSVHVQHALERRRHRAPRATATTTAIRRWSTTRWRDR